jgi:hypothetical protein
VADALQRINLNVPPAVRTELRALAAERSLTESEMARRLLVSALADARREQFYRRVAEAHSAELRARDLRHLRALDRLDD